jgi:hypothetical protein
MLQELSMVEQRYQAVREVLDGAVSISEVAIRFGVNRRTPHRWLVRSGFRRAFAFELSARWGRVALPCGRRSCLAQRLCLGQS